MISEPVFSSFLTATVKSNGSRLFVVNLGVGEVIVVGALVDEATGTFSHNSGVLGSRSWISFFAPILVLI